MRYNIVLFGAALLGLGACGEDVTGPHFSVAGRVLGANGQPVPRTTVEVRLLNGTCSSGAVDQIGEAVTSSLGEYRLWFTHRFGGCVRVTATLGSGAKVVVDRPDVLVGGPNGLVEIDVTLP